MSQLSDLKKAETNILLQQTKINKVDLFATDDIIFSAVSCVVYLLLLFTTVFVGLLLRSQKYRRYHDILKILGTSGLAISWIILLILESMRLKITVEKRKLHLI